MNTLVFRPGESIPDFDGSLLSSQRADLHLVLADGSARCSLWWTVVPPFPGERPGVIGHFAAESAETGNVILRTAQERLREAGCTRAIGPMDGNTWRRYRALTDRGAEPVFFMEPDNPDWWGTAFAKAGFSALSSYSSTLVTDLSQRDPRVERAKARLFRDGVTIRTLDPAAFEDDLRRIYQVSVESFTGNYLYTELPEASFLAQYLPYREKIRPELVQIAERSGEPVGYLFAIPDYAEALRGAPVRTVIGKTLAVRPGRHWGGLGVVLTNLLHARAAELGYERVIHALQHEGNDRVRNMSATFGQVMRRYTLFSQSLE
jgi:GNAT superfamily N-acetyltransferase